MLYPEIAELLEEEFVRFTTQRGKRTMARHFADWLGVSPTSLSQYMTGTRRPQGENLHRIGSKIPGIYDKVGEPRPIPDNEEIQRLVATWPGLSKGTQMQIMRLLDDN